VLVRASIRSVGSAVETRSTTRPGRAKGSKGIDIQEDIPQFSEEKFCFSLQYTRLAIL
jgi:hypothetical protein